MNDASQWRNDRESSGLTMHAKLGQRTEAGSEALFFADLSDVASDRMVIASPAETRSTYGEARKPNWPAIIFIALLHAVLFVGLIKYDIVVIKKKPTTLTVINVNELPPPPVEKLPPPPKVVPVEVVPQLVTPPPLVQPVAPPPPPIAAPVAPPKPTPSGPVMVGDLDEKLIEGNPPRYPVESRRKKEQGTVQLRLLIGVDGRVVQVSIAQSSGFERLDQAALQAAKSWRWQPMLRDGQPVEVRGIMSIPFVLKA
jgi:protein TonB